MSAPDCLYCEVNTAAARLGRPRVDILNAQEEARIRELVAANTWPDDWTGEEPLATDLLNKHFQDGTVQPLLPLFGRQG